MLRKRRDPVERVVPVLVKPVWDVGELGSHLAEQLVQLTTRRTRRTGVEDGREVPGKLMDQRRLACSSPPPNHGLVGVGCRPPSAQFGQLIDTVDEWHAINLHPT